MGVEKSVFGVAEVVVDRHCGLMVVNGPSAVKRIICTNGNEAFFQDSWKRAFLISGNEAQNGCRQKN